MPRWVGATPRSRRSLQGKLTSDPRARCSGIHFRSTEIPSLPCSCRRRNIGTLAQLCLEQNPLAEFGTCLYLKPLGSRASVPRCAFTLRRAAQRPPRCPFLVRSYCTASSLAPAVVDQGPQRRCCNPGSDIQKCEASSIA